MDCKYLAESGFTPKFRPTTTGVFIMKLRIAFLFCILIGGGVLSAWAQTTGVALAAASGQKDDRYRIGFQDVLSVQVFRHPDLDQKVAVSPNGTITLFRLDKPVVAVCKTIAELTSDLEAAYKAKYIKDPQVSVFAEQKSQSIAVIGAVVNPGNYFVTRKYQLLEILAQAGGPNKEAGSRLVVARTGSQANCTEGSASPADDANIEVVTFKIADVIGGSKTLAMQPGDIVSVLKSDIVYVYGNVKKQGPVEIREPTTLMQAIASAEGLGPSAKKEKIRILRQTSASVDRVEMVFDLNQIDKGKVKDPFLEPGDIVAVSEDRVKAILSSIGNSVKTALPSAVYRLP